ncbi:MAG: hypothetical protein KDA89_22545, partial [Planctomycetaceae bacterium]|nr:hypothetical protein [Planctomycetaceae bacterium]
MITSLDFGSYEIRCAYRTRTDRGRIVLQTERSEYTVLPSQDSFRDTLEEREISYADCDGSLVVFGNNSDFVRWLSRKPCAPLFTDGTIPTDDAPARQILNILTRAMLPRTAGEPGECWFTVPGGTRSTQTVEFLSRLIRMHGFQPHYSAAGEAVMLSSGSDCRFTGICIVMGAETCEISISRYGMELASETLHIGSNWIDTELARQFQIHVFDEAGNCYADINRVREWKHEPERHLRNGLTEQEKTLARLYGVVLNQVSKAVATLLRSVSSIPSMKGVRLNVVCAGGPTNINGFAGALTERFVENDIADRIVSIRIAEDAETAVVRGLLIQGELEQRR